MRSLKVALCVCLLPFVALANLPNFTNLDLRNTGSNGNGGGFISGATGTDRSQADAAFCSATDLVLVTTTTATSATCPFSSASVGNLINVTAGTGFTVQRCAVASVATVTATLTCQAATAGTGGSIGGSFALGGGLQTWAVAVAAVANTSYAKVWVKSGTYTVTSTVAFGTSTLGAVFEGYNATHGDLGTKPLLTTATDSTRLITLGTSTSPSVTFRNISFSNTASVRADGIGGNTNQPVRNVTLDRCLLDGFTRPVNLGTDGGFGYQTLASLTILKTEIKNWTINGITAWGMAYIRGSYIHGGTGDGIILSGCCYGAVGLTLIDSVVAGVVGDGVLLSSSQGGGLPASAFLSGNVFYNNSINGVEITLANIVSLYDNIFDSNGQVSGAGHGLAFTADGNGTLTADNNAYRNNKDGAILCATYTPSTYCTGPHDVTLTADPFVAAGTNYALNSTAGGGAALKGAGYIGAIPNAGTGVSDVGALQSGTAGATGGSSAYIQ